MEGMEESELIDNYLNNQLDAEQHNRFATQLLADKQLQEKVELRKLIINGIHRAYEHELKDKLIRFDKQLDAKSRFQFNWKIAAVVLLIAGGTWSIVSTPKPKPADFDIVEIGLPNEMGASSTVQLNNAMSIFKLENYEEAGKQFEDLLSENTTNDTLLYFSALCNYRTNRLDAAIKKWGSVQINSYFFEKSRFRLAIAYWAINDKKNCLELLKQCLSGQDDLLKRKSEEALKILE